ncbi:MAG: hypothetical protein CL946_07890 [Ectothiorhodospiraceae bacterium]|nr:hypothetical protein [Ectothiorhodospiraceae bacterium]
MKNILRHRAALVAIVLVLGAMSAAAQSDIDVTRVEPRFYPRIEVPLRIEIDGAIERMPDPARLIVKENGRIVQASIFCPEPDVVSASVAIGLERSLDNNFGLAKQAAKDFLAQMRFTDKGDNASYWAFATFIDQVVDMVRDSARLYREIDDTDVASFPFNGTPLFETLTRAIDDAANNGTEPARAVVFCTDGRNNTSNHSTNDQDVIGRAAAQGVQVYIIGVAASGGNAALMQSMAEATGGFYIDYRDTAGYARIYENITAQPPSTYWCTLSYESPLCPNGSSRQIEILYVTEAGDTLDASVSYTAPLLPAELDTLRTLAAPQAADFNAGDTIYFTFGAEVLSDLAVSELQFAVEHPGLRSIPEAWLLPGFESWGIDFLPGQDQSFVTLTPPDGTVIPSGVEKIARFRLVATEDGSSIQTVRLISDETGCLYHQEGPPASNVRIDLDTVLTQRGGIAEMPLNIDGNALFEGVSDLLITLVVPSSLSLAGLSPLPPTWYTETLSEVPQGNRNEIRLHVKGEPLDDELSPVAVRLAVAQDAAYFLPADLEAVGANPNSPQLLSASAPGLVVIQDSCRNDFNYMVTGLAVSEPSPQPIGSVATFSVRSPAPVVVTVSVHDALGDICIPGREYEIPAGQSNIVLDCSHLRRGSYFVRFSSGKDVRSRKVLVVR